ncbi:hypothetical protein PHYBLDRAFT_161917 [Phycomyces blakesleeanus NRRL 1555(-)]|uniref:Uncharacterized protein n=1 Tax=Phycomyces blakesleeanus (strain ATCC 8743b / DSM 1359 / FGSC 10004 / NBRC 33097 / NRRL 1555) TaxID=763407 RepID=A0A167RBR9_PHYB8|nr:hypothetical protein PHYBLDRAFT_161917 [Phycomyces blakesleeanus NRRL 1555(-)]OAD81304.1 hypothetical protein PHYBLDRAFT_161917 [Phycomyces blakesleeanus NRRL 1555(-)]|eukprot:XP_018299344.1 hypothetical protein PHYBLDRAFT_161917 [Phycomyces blakesleeanus NRRL 1555(-)]
MICTTASFYDKLRGYLTLGITYTSTLFLTLELQSTCGVHYNTLGWGILIKIITPKKTIKKSMILRHHYRHLTITIRIKRLTYFKQEGSSTLKLSQHFLVTYEKDTDPHVTVDVSKIMSGFDLMTKTVFKYTICIKRDIIYLPEYHQSNCSSKKHIPPHLSMTIILCMPVQQLRSQSLSWYFFTAY